ncbi:MAG TPA: DUF6600 domain-containing protein [Candidatus Sulfotelmatobacter sp.]
MARTRRAEYVLWGLAFLLSSLLVQAFGQENTSGDNPPSRVARISALRGDVSFLRAGMDQWSQAALNFPATTGDRIYTDKGARAELEIGPYTARMWERTDLTITNLNDQIMQLGLGQGSIRLSVRELSSGETVEVDTPNGALTLVDQGKYRIDVDPDGDHTLVSVINGRLEVSGGGVSQTVDAGQAVKLMGHDSIQFESIPMPPPDTLDAWSEERDLRLGSARSSKYVNPSTPGFDDLDEYGNWTEVAEYGPVWFPPVAVGWVPYRLGHWVWIDPWGWTWIEDEPWAFCPFHFGRWVLIGAHWGWLPGPFVMAPVYAPAFVAFLGGPGFSIGVGVGLVGWFPLGPTEPFFPWYHYGGNYLNVINVTNIRNVTNITNITNVTNISDVHYAYRTIATTAVPRDVFSSGQPVAHQAVRLNSQQLAKAQVIPHPAVNPTSRATLSGKPVRPPPVRAQRFAAASRTTESTSRSAPESNRQPAPIVTKKAPPVGSATLSSPPPPARTQPSSRNAGGQPRAESPRLITKAPPPTPVVPFEQRRPPMLEHPGRALEPPQLEDLQAGRPVRPMRDAEFPPHVPPLIRQGPVRASPAPRPVPPRPR